jgi:O-antigen/teichoic acid export membrane protein
MTSTPVSLDALPTTGTYREIAKQAAQGTVWSYLSFLLGKALTFFSTIILARLLAPEHFGLMGYCLAAIQYVDILNDFGMDAALISRRDRVEEAANTAFVIGLIMSLFFFGVSWITAPAVAVFFREPAVIPLFRTLSLVLLISGLALVPRALLRRGLRFKEKLLPDLTRNLAKGVFSIGLAWAGFGVWSLVWGQVAGEATAAIILWWLARWRPTLAMDWQVAREMLAFGAHIIGVGITGALRSNVDYLLIGRLLGAAALGYYLLAYRIPELVIRSLNFVVGNVAHPALAQLQSDVQQLRAVYFAYVRYIALFTFPAGVGLAAIARPFIRTVYTDKWEPSIVVMQFVAIAIGIASAGFVPGVLYKAINRPDILNKVSFIKLPIVVAVLWSCTRWGIVGVAMGQVGLSLFYMLLDSYVISRVVGGFGLGEVFRALWPAMIGATVMGAALTGVQMVFPLTGIIGLAALTLMGVVTYLATLYGVDRSLFAQTRVALQLVFRRS